MRNIVQTLFKDIRRHRHPNASANISETVQDRQL